MGLGFRGLGFRIKGGLGLGFEDSGFVGIAIYCGMSGGNRTSELVSGYPGPMYMRIAENDLALL